METTEFGKLAQAGLAVEALGLPVNPDTISQMVVFAKALDIYVEREQEYGSTWKQFDADDAAHHCVHKAARMRTAADEWQLKLVSNDLKKIVRDRAIDSAIDSINYAGFYVRHIEGDK